MITDADRLLTRGAAITIQGQALRVRFGMASLRYLEREYGGLDVFWRKLSESGFGATRIDSIFKGLVAGLLHTMPEEQEFADFERELEAKLEPKDLLQYLQAVVSAFVESIPEFENGSAPKAKGSRASSRGRVSTTSQPSSMGAPLGNSGR